MIRMVESSMKGESGPSKVVGYSKDDQDRCGTVALQLAWWNWAGTRVF